jgi:hypothetical protein
MPVAGEYNRDKPLPEEGLDGRQLKLPVDDNYSSLLEKN